MEEFLKKNCFFSLKKLIVHFRIYFLFKIYLFYEKKKKNKKFFSDF